jgi:hypothetical protein
MLVQSIPFSARVRVFSVCNSTKYSDVLFSLGVRGDKIEKLVDKFTQKEGRDFLKLDDPALSEPSNREIAEFLTPQGINFRITDDLRTPTEDDVLRILETRNPKNDSLGSKIPLRQNDLLAGGDSLTMVRDFVRNDIPGIIDFFNNCYREILSQAFTDVDYNINQTISSVVRSKAKLVFNVDSGSDGAPLFITLTYNGEKLMVIRGK